MARKYRDEQIADMRTKGWITPNVVAAAVHVAPSTVYRLYYNETVEGMKFGSALYLSEKSLMKHYGKEQFKALGI